MGINTNMKKVKRGVNMRTNFDKELDLLNKELIKMGSLVEDRIKGSVEALINRDENLAKNIIEGDIEVEIGRASCRERV